MTAGPVYAERHGWECWSMFAAGQRAAALGDDSDAESIDEAVWLLKQALLQDSALAPTVLRKLHELQALRRMFREMVAWDPPTTVAEACQVTEDSDFLCALDM